MLYIMRHQEGNKRKNCLSSQSIKQTNRIAGIFSNIRSNKWKVYTIKPSTHKHVRPIQTAANLCTYLNTSLKVCNTYEDVIDSLSNYIYTNDIIIVWHHNEIAEILDTIALIYNIRMVDMDGYFKWPEDNYNGCLIINTIMGNAFFSKHFFKKKKLCWFF